MNSIISDPSASNHRKMVGRTIAHAYVVRRAKRMRSELVRLESARGRILADDVIADRDQPPCLTSAMDGYALASNPELSISPESYRILGVSAAGDPYAGRLAPGECVRIFTGAIVPEGANRVALQEDVEVRDGAVFNAGMVQNGDFIRTIGSDFSRGHCVLKSVRRLEAPELVLAANAGFVEVPVFRRPVVAVLSTGDELCPPGEKPGIDQIASSNAVGVCSQIERAGGSTLDCGISADAPEVMRRKIADILDQCPDLLVTIGGASVGDRDTVRSVLREFRWQPGIGSVSVRPGKPFFFGAAEHSASGPVQVAGLPGNPASATICTALFVVPFVRASLGLNPALPIFPSVLTGRTLGPGGAREHFAPGHLRLNARLNQFEVTADPVQASSSSLATANADVFIICPPNSPQPEPGQLVSVLAFRPLEEILCRRS